MLLHLSVDAFDGAHGHKFRLYIKERSNKSLFDCARCLLRIALGGQCLVILVRFKQLLSKSCLGGVLEEDFKIHNSGIRLSGSSFIVWIYVTDRGMHMSRLILPARSSYFLTIAATLLSCLVHLPKKFLTANRTKHFSAFLPIGKNIWRGSGVDRGICAIFRRGSPSANPVKFSGGLLPRGNFCACGKERLGRVHTIINNSLRIDLALLSEAATWVWGDGCLDMAADNNMKKLMDLDSREGVQLALREYEEHQNLFSAYIQQVISRGPQAYVFINIILVIWVAQTIFSSHLNAIPKSLYLLSPLLAANPFATLTLQHSDQKCPIGQKALPLKTLPTIYSNRLSHQELFSWDDQQLQFCTKEIPQKKKGPNCQGEEVLCSGYCVKDMEECPITQIKVTRKDFPLQQGFQEIYLTASGKSFRICRKEGVPIVAIKAAFPTKCANDEHFNEAYNEEGDYWKAMGNCGKEGTITEFFEQIDQMETNSFFAINRIPITTTNSSMMHVTLGTVPEFHFSNDKRKGCEEASYQAQTAKDYFTAAAPAPQFSGILTGFSFVLLVADLLWLLGYYYIPQWLSTMNIITLGISIIQEVIVGFIYSNNSQLFSLEKVTRVLTNCLQEKVPALKEWDFGMENPQAFQMLLFVNTAYLGMHVSGLLYNYFCMQPYRKHQVLLPNPNSHFL